MEVVKKIKRSEIELRDRNAVLRGTKPNVCQTIFIPRHLLIVVQNFTNIKNVYTEKLKKMREANKPGAPPSVASASMPDRKMQARKARSNFPIIMVSSSPTALITMHNVKRFLQEAVYVLSHVLIHLFSTFPGSRHLKRHEIRETLKNSLLSTAS